jgi:hypothetical protein
MGAGKPEGPQHDKQSQQRSPNHQDITLVAEFCF